MKRLLISFLLLFAACASSFAQGFSLRELLQYKDRDNAFFHRAVTAKGYTYERSKYDERTGYYAYVFLDDIYSNFREVVYDYTGKKVKITFGTTEEDEYARMKKDLELLEFKFERYVPLVEEGRSVLMMEYSDGNSKAFLYNSYIMCEHNEYVRYYRLKLN